ncbi:MAG TPA: 2-C-methyl-D-erythritol 2,4-cyclodiphosphate synthase [Longimicrobiales bacterium]|nr:2-C-methyl-D-erythritol 2,4-cyclodiphosphate synthase [Longimicrobiales bacterium]
MRVGCGYDSHRFDPGRPLVLGGVEIPDEPGLAGHSDGDAVAHAITDAILGAGGAGDIGRHFPPDDDRWKDADSIGILRKAVEILATRDLRVVNADVTVVCQRPRIGPHAAEMRKRLADAMDLDAGAVSVKGKTNEGLGWIGAGEGLAVIAVALVDSLAARRGGYHGSTEGIPL